MPDPQLYLVRHGIAEDYAASARDADRALTREGERKTRNAARGLEALEVRVSLLVSSPLVRARQTADLIAERIQVGRSEIWEELSPGVDLAALSARMESVNRSGGVMLVGHEPDMGRISSHWLTGRADGFSVHFRKGAVACVCASALPPYGLGTLEWMLTAGQLGGLGRTS